MDKFERIKRFTNGLKNDWDFVTCDECGCSNFRVVMESKNDVPYDFCLLCLECGGFELGVEVKQYEQKRSCES